jgi:hypothetical protein
LAEGGRWASAAGKSSASAGGGKATAAASTVRGQRQVLPFTQFTVFCIDSRAGKTIALPFNGRDIIISVASDLGFRISGGRPVKSRTTALLALLALAACSDPVTEKPVDMQRGMYQAEVSGQFAGMLDTANMYKDGKQRSFSFCYRGLTDGYPTAPIEDLVNIDRRCDPAVVDRHGNQLTWMISCPLDPKKAVGSIKYTYTGVIKETSLDGTVQADIDIQVSNDPELDKYSSQIAAMTKLVKFRVNTSRVGDC